MKKSWIPYGASYSPLIFPEGEWERDLDLMRQSAMNLVRMGDVHGSWDRIEPQSGVYKFEILERFYRAAESRGIYILLSNGASCPPLWLKTSHPNISLLSSRGERYPLGSSYHWACIHHPGYLEALENYTLRLAEFAVQFSNHFGWQITNEIGFPFMPAREKEELGLYCYCQHCQSKFREWLQDKYRTLEELTEAWSWSTTNFVYNSWSEVEGPESLPSSWSGVTRWIDWRIFWQEAFAQFSGWQHQLIRRVDPDHPTSINTFNFKGYDRFGTFMGLDQWKLAAQVDHIGYDLYPGSGDKRKTRPEHSSMFLDHGRSVARTTGREFWLHEVESGPIGGWLMGPQYNTGPDDIDNYLMESIGHDGKLIIYMPWKEWGYQPIRWGALVDLRGNPTPRLETAARLGRFLEQEAKFLSRARVPQGEIAILESKPNAIFLRGVHQEELLFQAQRGAYRAFWDRGYSVDFITSTQLADQSLNNYQVVILPLLGLLSEADAWLLREYVLQGGILVGSSRLANLDERGWVHFDLPLEPLGEVFGLSRIEADTYAGQSIEFQGSVFEGAANRDRVRLRDGTDLLAEFSDGYPAATRARLGKGFGVYICTQAEIAYLQNPEQNLLGSLIPEVMRKGPRSCLAENNSRPYCVDPHLLEGPGRSLILFSNYAEEDFAVNYQLAVQDRNPEQVSRIYPDRAPLDFHQQAGMITIPLKFKQKEVMALEICWAEGD